MTTIDVGQIRFKKCAVCQEPSTNLIVKGVAIQGTTGSCLRVEVDEAYPEDRIEFRCNKHFGFSSVETNEKMFKRLQEMSNEIISMDVVNSVFKKYESHKEMCDLVDMQYTYLDIISQLKSDLISAQKARES